MKLFRQYTEILVGNKRITSNDLDIEFDIPFNRSKEQDIGEVTIYNLSNSTVNDIREHRNINVMAGYTDQGNIANIFTGTVGQVVTEWRGTDKATTLLLADGGYAWASSTLTKTYPANSKASEIIKDLINLMGNKPALVAPVNDIVYLDKLKVKGLKRTILADIVKETGSKMVNKSGFVYVNGGEPIGDTGFVLSSDTGLIGTPEEITELDNNGKKKTPARYSVEMLLNPLVTKGTKLKIQSRNLKGDFVVDKGSHNSDFTTTAEVVRWSGG